MGCPSLCPQAWSPGPFDSPMCGEWKNLPTPESTEPPDYQGALRAPEGDVDLGQKQFPNSGAMERERVGSMARGLGVWAGPASAPHFPPQPILETATRPGVSWMPQGRGFSRLRATTGSGGHRSLGEDVQGSGPPSSPPNPETPAKFLLLGPQQPLPLLPVVCARRDKKLSYVHTHTSFSPHLV